MDAMNVEETALVLIEYQNDFCSEGGTMFGAVKDVLEETNMLENSKALMDYLRDRGCKILHVPIKFSGTYYEVSGRYGVLKDIVASRSFLDGEWGSEIYEPMTPEEGDIIVEGKKGLCGFESTNLDFILRQNGVKNVILGGFLTNCCVESSMRTAYEKGFHVITLRDCTATVSMEAQNACFEYNFGMFSEMMTSEEVMARFPE